MERAVAERENICTLIVCVLRPGGHNACPLAFSSAAIALECHYKLILLSPNDWQNTFHSGHARGLLAEECSLAHVAVCERLQTSTPAQLFI